MSGSSQCPHSDLDYHFNNVGFAETNLHYLEIRAACKICGQKMRFRGPMGLTDKFSTVIEGNLSAPFIGEDDEYDGKMPGFGVIQREILGET